jgi:uncharacterized metal-binding protein (TIGR02443 family)
MIVCPRCNSENWKVESWREDGTEWRECLDCDWYFNLTDEELAAKYALEHDDSVETD